MIRKLIVMVSLVLLLASLGPLSCFAAEDSNSVISSFKAYLDSYFAGYAADNREIVLLCEGGWVKRRFQPTLISSLVVQQPPGSAIPYIATGEFKMQERSTYFHKTRAEAVADNNFAKSSVIVHRHKYSYQDGKWVPMERLHFYRMFNMTECKDCNEVIKAGPCAGLGNIYGCWEK